MLLQNPIHFSFSNGLKRFTVTLVSFDNSVLFNTTVGLGLLLPFIYTILIDESKSWQISGYPLVFTQLRFVIHSFWRPFQSRCINTLSCTRVWNRLTGVSARLWLYIKASRQTHFSILLWMMLSYTKINHEKFSSLFFLQRSPPIFSFELNKAKK